MNIFLLGINHKTAPIELREKFSVNSSQYDDFNDFFGKDGAVFEQLVLSTCNRTEIYGVTEDLNTTTEHAVTTFSRFSQIAPEHFREKLYQKSGEEAVRHLFTVASGLDSMALGETEILGQVKDAYQKAQTSRWTRKTLNTLFQKSLNVGKKVRSVPSRNRRTAARTRTSPTCTSANATRRLAVSGSRLTSFTNMLLCTLFPIGYSLCMVLAVAPSRASLRTSSIETITRDPTFEARMRPLRM